MEDDDHPDAKAHPPPRRQAAGNFASLTCNQGFRASTANTLVRSLSLSDPHREVVLIDQRRIAA
jgi:hypothetical protein